MHTYNGSNKRAYNYTIKLHVVHNKFVCGILTWKTQFSQKDGFSSANVSPFCVHFRSLLSSGIRQTLNKCKQNIVSSGSSDTRRRRKPALINLFCLKLLTLTWGMFFVFCQPQLWFSANCEFDGGKRWETLWCHHNTRYSKFFPNGFLEKPIK